MSADHPKLLKRPKTRPRPASDPNWKYAGQPVRTREVSGGRTGGLWRLAMLVILLPALGMAGLRAYRQFPSVEAAKAFLATAIDRELTVSDGIAKASLTITTNPEEGVSVWIDGLPVGKTPLDPLVIDIGPHQVSARHPLYGTKVTSIVATRSQQLSLNIDLGNR